MSLLSGRALAGSHERDAVNQQYQTESVAVAVGGVSARRGSAGGNLVGLYLAGALFRRQILAHIRRHASEACPGGRLPF